MEKFQINDKVMWTEEMATVPHPDGKIGIDGNVLSVFRTVQRFGRIIDMGIKNLYTVRPDFAESYKNKICGERYYDVNIEENNLSKVN